MAQLKKIPKRMCVGCREMKPKKELVRVVAALPDAGGGVAIDLKGKQNGRGAYVCRDVACLEKAKKTGALSRALEREISDSVYAALAAEMSFGGGQQI